MKCSRGKRVKYLLVTIVFVVILKNLTFIGSTVQVGMYNVAFIRSMGLNTSSTAVHTQEILNSTESVLHPIEKLSDGYNLAERLNRRCNRSVRYLRSTKVFGTYKSGSVETCIIWKIGTTVIKRLYMMKELPQFRNIVNPYTIPFDKRYLPVVTISNDQAASRFMFVRDPYSRLVSGYVDKLFAPNPVYWKIIGIPAIRATRKRPGSRSLSCGHDLQFNEYVKYVIKAMDPKNRGAKPDGHFDKMTKLCKPCDVKYSFVGKMESFAEDSLELLRRLNVSNETTELMETEGANLAWMDAIKDTAHQPFDPKFKKDYIMCVSFYEALKRSWEKMQMRGIIGRQDFPLQESETKSLSEVQFVQLAIKAREKSTSQERKQLHRDHFLKMFSSVPKSDLELIRTIYAQDFELFEYDDRPDILFGNTIHR